MKIFDTLSGSKKEITKDQEKKMFVCGPTVYDHAHIGHARTYLAFDIIVRYLRSRSWSVFYLQNITDVDDKIINRGRERKINPFTLARTFERSYHADMRSLGVISVNRYARASAFIPQIRDQIRRHLEADVAYETDTGIYFRVRSFPPYGKLSKQVIDAQQSGSRKTIDDTKEDPLDFALWKKATTQEGLPRTKRKKQIIRDGEPLWWSPWGWGRPGWHIEDTAITESVFGPHYDWHGGAEDLKFPHHEAEIAQQESITKTPLVDVWMHTGVLSVGGEKMSKSLGNFVTIKDFLKQYDPQLFRWMIFTHHYRSRLQYTEDALAQAAQSLNGIIQTLDQLRYASAQSTKKKSEIADRVNRTVHAFHEAMEDDFNTPQAASVIFTLINDIQPSLWNLSRADARLLSSVITTLLASVGITVLIPAIPRALRHKAKKREIYRGNKQFVQADALRKELEAVGYGIEDTPLGPRIFKPYDGTKKS